ncbi:hypothetical protein V8G69_00335 [Gaetbulibacter sp. M235]|uniref:hypothetical protein n=1 Tax=Gaetbulibacter sp. M235 TaxID=3126510 RepID=UPI00374E95B9
MKFKSSILKKALAFLLLVLVSSMFQFCKSSKAVTTNSKEIVISYIKNIAPIIERSCSPCHFPENGKKKWLNTYDAVKNNIEDILTRVQLPATDEKFMPFRNKKPALTEEEVALFKKWVAQKMAE